MQTLQQEIFAPVSKKTQPLDALRRRQNQLDEGQLQVLWITDKVMQLEETHLKLSLFRC